MPWLSREKTLFLLVGGWNTVFGIALYALMLMLCSPWANYLVILLAVQLIALTQAFLLYRRFVFSQHTGSPLASYVRFCIVSTGNAALGSFLVWLAVSRLHWHPALANALVTMLLVIANYIGHKHVSFRSQAPA